MFSVPDAISVRNPVLFKIGILMISTMKSNKPRVLVSGVGTRFGGTETVVAAILAALSLKNMLSTLLAQDHINKSSTQWETIESSIYRGGKKIPLNI